MIKPPEEFREVTTRTKLPSFNLPPNMKDLSVKICPASDQCTEIVDELHIETYCLRSYETCEHLSKQEAPDVESLSIGPLSNRSTGLVTLVEDCSHLAHKPMRSLQIQRANKALRNWTHRSAIRAD